MVKVSHAAMMVGLHINIILLYFKRFKMEHLKFLKPGLYLNNSAYFQSRGNSMLI